MKSSIILTAVFSVFGLVGGATDAFAVNLYEQSNNIRGPDVNDDCSGAIHGWCRIKEIASSAGTSPLTAGNILVDCKLEKATPNTSYIVVWQGTTVARGCHIDATACAALIGSITTNRSGNARFQTTLPDSPCPGEFVHIEIDGDVRFPTVFGAVPIGAPGPSVRLPAPVPVPGE